MTALTKRVAACLLRAAQLIETRRLARGRHGDMGWDPFQNPERKKEPDTESICVLGAIIWADMDVEEDAAEAVSQYLNLDIDPDHEDFGDAVALVSKWNDHARTSKRAVLAALRGAAAQVEC